MRKQNIWKVRVRRAVEDWVDVQADTGPEAEVLAASIPQVISVFGKSAMPGNITKEYAKPHGVVDDDGE